MDVSYVVDPNTGVLLGVRTGHKLLAVRAAEIGEPLEQPVGFGVFVVLDEMVLSETTGCVVRYVHRLKPKMRVTPCFAAPVAEVEVGMLPANVDVWRLTLSVDPTVPSVDNVDGQPVTIYEV